MIRIDFQSKPPYSIIMQPLFSSKASHLMDEDDPCSLTDDADPSDLPPGHPSSHPEGGEQGVVDPQVHPASNPRNIVI